MKPTSLPFILWGALWGACGGSSTSQTIPYFEESLMPSAQSTITDPTVPCPFELDSSQVLGQTARCGYLHVYENRSVPNSPVIKVPLLIFKGTNSTLSPEVELAGGPGQSWQDLGLNTINTSESDQFKRDVVFFEQRGTGLSLPNLGCPEASDPSITTDAEYYAALAKCQTRLVAAGIDLTAYNTRALAADVEDMRTSLGYDQLIINGTSYGTLWALTIMRDFGGNLQSVILDSTLPPQDPAYGGSASGRDRALTALENACMASAACNGAFPDLDAKLTNSINSLTKTMINFPALGGMIGPDDYVEAVDQIQFLMPQLLPFFIESVNDAILLNKTPVDDANGDLAALFGPSSGADIASLALGMYLSVSCSDNSQVTIADVQADAAKARPVLQPYLLADSEAEVQQCQQWTYMDYPASAFTPVVSSVPTVLLSGALDDRTPPSWAMDAVQTLSKGQLISFPGLSHSVQSADTTAAQTCIGNILTQFITNNTVADSSCAATITADWILQ